MNYYVTFDKNSLLQVHVSPTNLPPTNIPINSSAAEINEAPKVKRIRTTFTADQLIEFEREYNKEKYIERMTRIKIAKRLNLNEKQVKIWFQNRRMKDKKVANPTNLTPQPQGPTIRTMEPLPSLSVQPLQQLYNVDPNNQPETNSPEDIQNYLIENELAIPLPTASNSFQERPLPSPCLQTPTQTYNVEANNELDYDAFIESTSSLLEDYNTKPLFNSETEILNFLLEN